MGATTSHLRTDRGRGRDSGKKYAAIVYVHRLNASMIEQKYMATIHSLALVTPESLR